MRQVVALLPCRYHAAGGAVRQKDASRSRETLGTLQSMRMVRLYELILATVILLTCVEAKGVANPVNVPDAGAAARELEHRLFAPCCWRETLAVHESPIATALRKEIRQRIAGGESVAQVEADLIARYGSQLRAQLPGNLGYIIFGFAVGFGLFLLYSIVKPPQSGHQATVKLSSPVSSQLTSREQQKYGTMLDDDLDDERI